MSFLQPLLNTFHGCTFPCNSSSLHNLILSLNTYLFTLCGVPPFINTPKCVFSSFGNHVTAKLKSLVCCNLQSFSVSIFVCCCNVSAAVEVLILKFLESCIVYEGEDVHFECQLSHEDAPQIQWKLQDVPLQNNEMNLIKSEGQVHSLTLRSVTAADSGIVSFTVGNQTSTASITVRGKNGRSHFKQFPSKLSFGLLSFFSIFILEGNVVNALLQDFLNLIVTSSSLISTSFLYLWNIHTSTYILPV